MPLLPDINAGSAIAGDPATQISSLTKQLNEWGRIISNERRTDIYKDDAGNNRIIIGVLPDGTTGIVISKEGIDVETAFST